jgi:hypothetical protein
MGTQSVVSLVNYKEETIIKVIVGCNGFNSLTFSDKLKKLYTQNKDITLKEIYDLALLEKFGCVDCLIVINSTDIFCKDKEEVSSLHREKFLNPTFNSRWEQGIADYPIVVKV